MRHLCTFPLAVCLLAVAAVPSAHADEASRRAKAEQMMALTHSDEAMKSQLTALQERVSQLTHQQFAAAATTPEQKAAEAEYLIKAQAITDDEVGWAKLRPIVVQSYADSFTDEQFDSIIAFYKSPAGQAVVNKTPELSRKTVTLVEDHIKDMQPKLTQLTQEYAAKMKPAGAAPTLQPRTTPPPAAPAK